MRCLSSADPWLVVQRLRADTQCLAGSRMMAATYGLVLRSDLQFVWGLGFIQ
jgi:hypothetical protein